MNSSQAGSVQSPEEDPPAEADLARGQAERDAPQIGSSNGPHRQLISVLISAVALFLAAIHLLRPKLNIDAITIVLIAVAALPWLGSIFKAIELPGVGRVEYQELRRQQQQVRHELAQVQESVRKVEQIIFSREVSPDLAQRLREQIETFHQYLAALGLEPYEREPPRIGLNPDTPGSFYDPATHRIEISPDLADSQHIVFREYCNYVLSPDDISVGFDVAAYDLKSGLSFYFPCSFTDDPAGFSPFGINLDNARPMVRRRGTPSPENQPRAYIWASIFLEAQQLMDPRAEDKLIAAAWLETLTADSKTNPPADKPRRVSYRTIEDRFIQRMYGLAPAYLAPEDRQALAELLVRRRVLVAGPPSALEP